MRSVSAIRPDVDSTGWQQMKISRRTSSSMWSGSTVPGSTVPVPLVSSSRAISSVLRSSVLSRRSRSIARCLAVAMSQAPGLSGTPDSGHCSSAATSASWARSSASPTSRTIRVRPAIRRVDSIRQTASIAWWVAACDTRPLRLAVGGRLVSQAVLQLAQLGRHLVAEIVGLEDLPDLDLAATLRRVRAALGPLDGLVERLALPQPVAGDQLLGLGERPVDDAALRTAELHARTLRAGVESLALEHHARLHELLVVPAHRGEQLLAGHLPCLGLLRRLHHHYEPRHLSLLCRRRRSTGASNDARRNRQARYAATRSGRPKRSNTIDLARASVAWSGKFL